jgi:hypothetical protein
LAQYAPSLGHNDSLANRVEWERIQKNDIELTTPKGPLHTKFLIGIATKPQIKADKRTHDQTSQLNDKCSCALAALLRRLEFLIVRLVQDLENLRARNTHLQSARSSGSVRVSELNEATNVTSARILHAAMYLRLERGRLDRLLCLAQHLNVAQLGKVEIALLLETLDRETQLRNLLRLLGNLGIGVAGCVYKGVDI